MYYWCISTAILLSVSDIRCWNDNERADMAIIYLYFNSLKRGGQSNIVFPRWSI